LPRPYLQNYVPCKFWTPKVTWNKQVAYPINPTYIDINVLYKPINIQLAIYIYNNTFVYI
jgi:hypothetical protein